MATLAVRRVGQVRCDPMAMLLFCSYIMGQYDRAKLSEALSINV